MTNIQGTEISKMSNLITDMTIAGASQEEIERAVKHSQVAMEFDRSVRDNEILELVVKYQDSANTRVARLLMTTDRYTIAEAADIMGLPVGKIQSLLES